MLIVAAGKGKSHAVIEDWTKRGYLSIDSSGLDINCCLRKLGRYESYTKFNEMIEQMISSGLSYIPLDDENVSKLKALSDS
ncbi:MAG: hypothetical protein K1000chlam2_01428 [Chlamydiae bacterium]|nr:hypothetical protein [Chlamydiota bacterium]